jgi:hypothetical protein
VAIGGIVGLCAVTAFGTVSLFSDGGDSTVYVAPGTLPYPNPRDVGFVVTNKLNRGATNQHQLQHTITPRLPEAVHPKGGC